MQPPCPIQDNARGVTGSHRYLAWGLPRWKACWPPPVSPTFPLLIWVFPDFPNQCSDTKSVPVCASGEAALRGRPNCKVCRGQPH